MRMMFVHVLSERRSLDHHSLSSCPLPVPSSSSLSPLSTTISFFFKTEVHLSHICAPNYLPIHPPSLLPGALLLPRAVEPLTFPLPVTLSQSTASVYLSHGDTWSYQRCQDLSYVSALSLVVFLSHSLPLLAPTIAQLISFPTRPQPAIIHVALDCGCESSPIDLCPTRPFAHQPSTTPTR